MADVSFENRLLRMFDEPPALSDADRFARDIEARLDRGWGMRRLMIGAFGVFGGVIGTVQLMGSGFAPELERAARQSTSLVTERIDSAWRASFGMAGIPLSGEVLWMAAALGVMALALAVTRAVEEF